jgi:hypothetical protein
MTNPGNGLRTLAARWCSARTVARLIDPTLADMQVEYRDAAERGRPWQAFAIRVRGARASSTGWAGESCREE